jgi:hypothetical protein
MMPSDRYIKIVLTIIAACLIWLCAMSTGRPIQAQPQPPAVQGGPPQAVVVVGWGTMDEAGRITVMRTGGRENSTDPNLPVKVMETARPIDVHAPRPIDVRLDYSAARPMPVGITEIRPAGEWAPIRSSVEGEPVRPKPGR